VIHDQAAIESGMLRIKDIKNAKRAESYYAKSDGGYYLNKDELRCEWAAGEPNFSDCPGRRISSNSSGSFTASTRTPGNN
jgi:hypothetical protein